MRVSMSICAAVRVKRHYLAAEEGSIDAVQVLLERGANILIQEDDTFMKALDIAKVKAAEAQKAGYHYWKEPRDDNYASIVEMLEERVEQS